MRVGHHAHCARELNTTFGQGTVSATAPYFWRDHGGVPHAPLPALVSYTLSDRLGRRVTIADIWGDRALIHLRCNLPARG